MKCKGNSYVYERLWGRGEERDGELIRGTSPPSFINLIFKKNLDGRFLVSDRKLADKQLEKSLSVHTMGSSEA